MEAGEEQIDPPLHQYACLRRGEIPVCILSTSSGLVSSSRVTSLRQPSAVAPRTVITSSDKFL